MRLRDLSLERKFFLVILPVCLLPAILLSALLAIGSRVAHEQTMAGELGKQTSLFAERFNAFLDLRIDRLSSELSDPSAGPSASLASLADVIVRLSGGDPPDVHVLNPQTDSAVLLNQALARTIDLWPAASSGAIITDLRISVPGRIDSACLVVVAVPQPEGRITLTFIDAIRLINQFRGTLSVPPDFFLVASHEGNPVYSSLPLSDSAERRIRSEVESGPVEGGWFTLTVEGHPYLVSRAPASRIRSLTALGPSGGWEVLLTYGLESYLWPQDRLIWLAVIFGLVLVLLVLAIAIVLARRIVQPLHDLKRQAALLADGHLEVRASARSRDEIGGLADAFNSMAIQLQKTWRELQMRLDESNLRGEQINAINELAHGSLQSQDLPALFATLRRSLARILPYDAIWLARLGEGAHDLRVLEIWPERIVALEDGGRIPIANSLHGAVLERGETLHAEIGPDQRGDFFETRVAAAEGFQSFLIAPVPSRQGMLGVLGIASITPDAYDARLADVLTSVAGAVGLALEQNEVFHQLSQFADELERKVLGRTEQLEQARAKLTQTGKHFALGRLAGNLAHEINNPLGIIRNYLQLVRGNLAHASGGRRSTDPSLEQIGVIEEEVDRIARLVRHLLDLYRPADEVVQPVDLNRILEEILALMEEPLRARGIRLVRQFSPDLPHPLASPDLIRQLFINLIRNAQDAMEDGGELTLSTSFVPNSTPGCGALRVLVSDTGCGIAPENLSQVFDPFFTTKPAEKGTGLGLAVSYGIVHRYGGSIDLSSTPGQGTRVCVEFPIPAQQID